MNILDEHIPENQRQLLESWGFKCKQIGNEVGYKGILDKQIITILHRLQNPTFFTRDQHFYNRKLCHNNYCLCFLDIGKEEVSVFIRDFMKHKQYNMKAKRMGNVFKIKQSSIRLWKINNTEEIEINW